jgi:hypothetical protein
MSLFKKCKLNSPYVTGAPGTVFTAYGHKFIIQANGDAVGSIHKDFVENEVKSGRLILLKDNIKEKPVATQSDELSGFTMDIGTYFGAGDLEKLHKKVTILRKEAMQGFANSRLNLELPDTLSRNKMVVEIMSVVNAKDDKKKDE